jgi:ribosome biogenesis SPOUT family RNA methylase Rps3
MKKKNIVIFFLTLLLIPAFTVAEPDKTIEIQGIIGDSAPRSRTYEVDRKIYQFDEDIIIQNEAGEILGFDALRGGTEIKIIGEKIADPKAKGKEEIKYIRIIVLK